MAHPQDFVAPPSAARLVPRSLDQKHRYLMSSTVALLPQPFVATRVAGSNNDCSVHGGTLPEGARDWRARPAGRWRSGGRNARGLHRCDRRRRTRIHHVDVPGPRAGSRGAQRRRRHGGGPSSSAEARRAAAPPRARRAAGSATHGAASASPPHSSSTRSRRLWSRGPSHPRRQRCASCPPCPQSTGPPSWPPTSYPWRASRT